MFSLSCEKVTTKVTQITEIFFLFSTLEDKQNILQLCLALECCFMSIYSAPYFILTLIHIYLATYLATYLSSCLPVYLSIYLKVCKKMVAWINVCAWNPTFSESFWAWETATGRWGMDLSDCLCVKNSQS